MAIIPAWRANAFVLTSSPDRPSVACADFYTPAGSGLAIEDFGNRFTAICRANAGPVLFDLAGAAAQKTTWSAVRGRIASSPARQISRPPRARAAVLVVSTLTQPRGGAADPRLGEGTDGAVPPSPSDGIALRRERKGFLTMRPRFGGIASAARHHGISRVIAAHRIGQPG